MTDVTVRCSPLVREPLSETQSVDLAAVFKALADPIRLRLFSLIASHENGEACVCDLTDLVGLAQPTVSHHLKVLVEAGLLEREKRGTNDVYLMRVEQLVPFPLKTLVQELGRFKNAEVVWCQEEPRNNGSWFFVESSIEDALAAAGKPVRPSSAGRAASAVRSMTDDNAG